VGTERARTNYNGDSAATFTSLPFGDAQTTTSGSNYDAYHFAGLDTDVESGTDHAQFRQYSSTQGRWLSSDPFGGSYDFTNPQSFNRYAYALNRPSSAIDPTGLMMCNSNNCVLGPGEGGGGGDCWPYSDYGCGDCDPLFFDCSGGGGGGGGGSEPSKPRFMGYKDLDPNRIMNESLGLPAGMRLPTGDILDIFGIGGGVGCEFGECGGIGNPFIQGGAIAEDMAFVSWCDQYPRACALSVWGFKKAIDKWMDKGSPASGLPFKFDSQTIDCVSNLANDTGQKFIDWMKYQRSSVDPQGNLATCMQGPADSVTRPWQRLRQLFPF
jgi:RHS repeat-associated protein